MKFKQRKTQAEYKELFEETFLLFCSTVSKAFSLHRSMDRNPPLLAVHPSHRSHSPWHTDYVF